MLTNKQKADKLRQAIDLLEQADALQQEAIGASDVCFETHNRIWDVIEDLVVDAMELEEAEQE